MGIVDRGPGKALPLRLGRLIAVEGTVPALAMLVGRLREMRILVRAADHPIAQIASVLLDPIACLGIVHRCPGPGLPDRLRCLVAVEGTDAFFRPAAGDSFEGRISVLAADHPVLSHSPPPLR